MIQTVIALVVGTLDSIPDAIRAMLSALVLASAVGLLGRRINVRRVGFNVAYRQAALAALIGIPLVIWLALDWRFIVVVEEIPPIASAPTPIWWSIYAVWGAGAAWHLFRIGRRTLALGAAPAGDVPGKVGSRLEIWCKRLGIDPRRVALALDGDDRPRMMGWRRATICLPRACERWRTPTLDAVLLHELTHVRQCTWRWLLSAEIVAALYWPTPWIRRLVPELNDAFQRLADSRAIATLHDAMGYRAALRDMADRIGDDVHRFPLDPLIAQWGDRSSVRDRGEVGSSDPLYDRVFWALAQATLAVFLLTGTTLREARSEDEHASLIQFNPFNLVFERNEKYMDKPPETRR